MKENSNRENIEDNLDRIDLLKSVMEDITSDIETEEKLFKLNISSLEGYINQLKNHPNYYKSKDAQDMVKEFKEEIDARRGLLKLKLQNKKEKFYNYKEDYDKLLASKININCKNLLDELKLLLAKNDLYMFIDTSLKSNKYIDLPNIIQENQKRKNYLNIIICDKKEQKNDFNENNIYYKTSIPFSFDEIQKDGKALYEHMDLNINFEGNKRVASVIINNTDDINLNFRLQDLKKEQSSTFKPARINEIFKDAICNCKEREYKLNNNNNKIKNK